MQSRSATDKAAANKFGTFAGVFTPSILTILGAVMFLRGSFVVGQAGLISALAILLIAESITYLTALSISAISTNIHLRGGGAYFMISRALGPEIGGAIGIVLFIAQALSVPFYILGFTEALVTSFDSLKPYVLIINLSTAAILFCIAYIGAQWAIRAQYVIMTVLGLSIISFLGGLAAKANSATFSHNLAPSYTAIFGADGFISGHYSFWVVFAIFFPAVTGILAGVNMSGDLRNPARSIPRGTLLAITAGLLVYLSQFLLSAAGLDRELLLYQPFEALRDNAFLAGGMLVVAGVFAATLSSALGSYLGAPRVMQAVARDDLLGILKIFSKGSLHRDEPRRALVLTGMITLAVLYLASRVPGGAGFNAVATLITMFFLYTYGMVNVAAFIESASNNPSFRPRFRVFHWSLALLGSLGCGIAAFLIAPFPAVVALLMILGLYFYLRSRQLSSTYGDVRRGFIYSTVRNFLLQLASLPEHTRNWRPTILAFTGNPSTREALVAASIWLSSGRGIVQLASVLISNTGLSATHYRSAVRQMERYSQRLQLNAFPTVLMAENLKSGISNLLQTAGIGPIKPNLAVFGWPDQPSEQFFTGLRLTVELGLCLAVVRCNALPGPGRGKLIQVVWSDEQHGALMLLLSHLLSHNWEWSGARIEVLRKVQQQEGAQPAQAALQSAIHEARISAEARVIVSREPYPIWLTGVLDDADCVFSEFSLPQDGEAAAWHENFSQLTDAIPLTYLVYSQESSNILA